MWNPPKINSLSFYVQQLYNVNVDCKLCDGSICSYLDYLFILWLYVSNMKDIQTLTHW